MEPMLMTHVLPEFKNTNQQGSGFMKVRACWLYGEFGDYNFKDKDHLKTAVDSIYQCLFDDDLPVRYTAATSIHKLLYNETALVFLKPALK